MCNPLMFAAVAILMAAFANRNGIANQGLWQRKGAVSLGSFRMASTERNG